MPIPLVGLAAAIFPVATASILRSVGAAYVMTLVVEKVNDFMTSIA